MTTWGEYSVALEYRRAMEGIVGDVLAERRPAYRYAKVVNADYANGKCEVLYPGEPTTNVVNMNTVRPMAVGQWVRVEGLGGDRFISSVQDGRSDLAGEFLFSEPFLDPSAARDILAKLDAGVLKFTGQSSDKTLLTMNEATGAVTIPNLDRDASNLSRLVFDSRTESAAAFNTGSTGEYFFGQSSFVMKAGHAFRYRISVFYTGGPSTAITRVRASSSGTPNTGNVVVYLNSQPIEFTGTTIEIDAPLPRAWTPGVTYYLAYTIQPGQMLLYRDVSVQHPYTVQIWDDGEVP
jgi:hypothetical protein